MIKIKKQQTLSLRRHFLKIFTCSFFFVISALIIRISLYDDIRLSGKFVQLYPHYVCEMFSLYHRAERAFLAWLIPFWLDCILCFAQKTKVFTTVFQISYFEPTRQWDTCFTNRDTQFCRFHQGLQDTLLGFEFGVI